MSSTSNGEEVYACDAEQTPDGGVWGCEEWKVEKGVELRKNCTKKSPFMDWVKSPVRSDAYEIRSEMGAISYSPGQNIAILVKTLKDPGFKYRGLLLHAVDSNGTSVGSGIRYPGIQVSDCGGGATIRNLTEPPRNSTTNLAQFPVKCLMLVLRFRCRPLVLPR